MLAQKTASSPLAGKVEHKHEATLSRLTSGVKLGGLCYTLFSATNKVAEI